jgi:hypothetical protein
VRPRRRRPMIDLLGIVISIACFAFVFVLIYVFDRV